MTIGNLGGTGPQGRGLTRRLAAAGHPVVIGSRSADRAQVALTANMIAINRRYKAHAGIRVTDI